MPTSCTNAIFRSSRFCLKISAIEISSVLRISFVNMFLNSHFTNSTKDEVFSKIHTKNKVAPTQKNYLFFKVNDETQPFIEGYFSQSLLWDNWVVTFLQNKLDVKKVDHSFLKFRKDTSLDLLLANINSFFIINPPSCCYNFVLSTLRHVVISLFFSFFFLQFCFTHQFLDFV